MTTSDQLPAATNELTLCFVFANPRSDLHCRSDVHRRPLVVLPASTSLRDNLLVHPRPARFAARISPRYLRPGFDLSFPSVPHHELEIQLSVLKFNFDIGLCLVTACLFSVPSESRESWLYRAAPPGAAQRLNKKLFNVMMGAIPCSGAAQPRGYARLRSLISAHLTNPQAGLASHETDFQWKPALRLTRA